MRQLPFFVALYITSLLFVFPAHSALNDTGVTVCGDYAFDGGSGIHENNHNCLLTEDVNLDPIPDGQDGHYGRDFTDNDDSDGHAGFSFTKIGANREDLSIDAPTWSCVRDEVSGLIWEVKTTDSGLRHNAWTYSWLDLSPYASQGAYTDAACDLQDNFACNADNYVTRVNEEGLCGYNDWILPTATELLSITDLSKQPPDAGTLNAFFPYTSTSKPYWSATENAKDPARAWSSSAGGISPSGTIDLGLPIRLVRGRDMQSHPPITPVTGQSCNPNIPVSTPSSRFTINDDGTVTDSKTGLMWKRCAENFSGEDCSIGNYDALTWQEALNYAEQSEFSGYTDWRVPNAKELASITEYSCYQDAINREIFPTPGVLAWSSTPAPQEPDLAYSDYFYYDGIIYPMSKNMGLLLHMVRGGEKDVNPGDYKLTINRTGSGSGRVYSMGNEIDCGTTCSAYLDIGATRLIAETDPGSTFIGWNYSGCNPEKNECNILLDLETETIVEAIFDKSTAINDPKIIFVGICGAGPWGNECVTDEGWFDPRQSTLWDSHNPLNWGDLIQIGENDSGIIASGLKIGTLFPNSIVNIASFSVPTAVLPPQLNGKLIVETLILPFYNPGDKVVLMGHSYGGVVVTDIIKKLSSKKIPVFLAGWMDVITKKIKVRSNVIRAYNYYYPLPIYSPCPRGARKIKAKKNAATLVTNTPIVDPKGGDEGLICVEHRNMDNDSRVWVSMMNYVIQNAVQ